VAQIHSQSPRTPDKHDDDSSTEFQKEETVPKVAQIHSQSPSTPDKHDDDSSTEEISHSASNLEDFQDFNVTDTTESEFDDLWEDKSPSNESKESPSKSIQGESQQEPTSQLHSMNGGTQTIIESCEEDEEDHNEAIAEDRAHVAQNAEVKAPAAPEGDHPWDTPKYRRNSSRPEMRKAKSSGPAQFIDPTLTSDVGIKSSSTASSAEPSPAAAPQAVKDEPVAADDSQKEPPVTSDGAKVMLVEPGDVSAASVTKSTPSSMKSIAENQVKGADLPTPDLSSDQPGVLSKDPPGKSLKPIKTSFSPPPPRKTVEEKVDFFDEPESAAFDEPESAIHLKHQLPGTDPTLRIQVHNDLIAWESKRRSDLSKDLQFNREQWKAAREILRDSVAEVEFAERLVLGFAKAGVLFADALQAMYDDKLLDDAGNTVTNSFVQNRLAKQRSVQEYSIESDTKATSVEAGQSALLNSIIDSQLSLAAVFRDTSRHMEEEIVPEISELRAEIQSSARELESRGDSMLAELKRSEIEVKNIWGTFERRLS
jgi:hypothetical protein